MASASEQAPVPGISLAGSMPLSTSSSSSSMRSSRPSELPSLVVPNGASPVQPSCHQPLAVLDEALGIGPAVLAEGGEHRGDDAREIAVSSACALPSLIGLLECPQAGIGMPGCLTGT